MKKQFYQLLLLGGIITATTACKTKSSFPTISHVPFKEVSSDNYGMIGIDGTVLFENEFEQLPSVVVNGVFAVTNEDENIEYYTAEKTPQPINEKSYVQGGCYTEGVIPVVETEQGITFIKKNGDVAFTLKEYNGKSIIAVNAYFTDGRCLFKTEDNKYGYIDPKGKVVIKPTYLYAMPFNEGVAVVGDNPKNSTNNTSEATEFKIINTAGKTIAKLKAEKTEDEYFRFYNNIYSDGLLFFRGKVFDKKGELAFRVPAKVYQIFPYHNGYAIFEDNNGKYGLINKKGEITIRAKYDRPGRIIGDRVFFYTDNDKTEFVNFSGERILDFDSRVFPTTRNRSIILENGEYYFIDKSGKSIDKSSYYYLFTPELNINNNLFIDYNDSWDAIVWVESDYLDTDAAATSILSVLNKDGVGPIKLGMPVTELTQYYDMGDCSKYEYKYTLNYKGITGSGGLQSNYRVEFTHPVAYYFGYNREAKVHHIYIDLDYNNITVSNARERIRTATISYLNGKGFSFVGHIDNWNDEPWDVYQSDLYNYSIAINTDGSTLCLEAYD